TEICQANFYHPPIKIVSCHVGTEGPGVSLTEERQSAAESTGVSVIYNPYASLSIEQQRQKLPVFKLRNHILYLVENYQTLVIVGETGCGKSTQIPQYLAEAGWTAEGRVVGVTQPRRVAAVSVSSFFFAIKINIVAASSLNDSSTDSP
uniref:DHX35 n=1 Tax=Chrysemys picta bellii TaxID=8478 RepID=A0A8C3HYJ5_CHRPI